MKFQLRSLFFYLLLFSTFSAQATHNVGGEIGFRQTGILTLEGTIITYTNANALPADRDYLTICWGDGQCESIARVNGPDFNGNGIPDGEIIAPGTKMNVYQQLHTYEEADTYKVSMTDPNRVGDILNLNFPNSDQITFHVETQITLSSNPENNHSPVLLEPVVGMGAVGQPFYHIPNAYDPDGDSLAYELIVPMEALDTDVPNYVWPDMIPQPDPISNSLSINSITGLVTWDAPQKAGLYTLAIKVTSYRNGTIQDVVIRDMLITIAEGLQAPNITVSEQNQNVIDVQVGDIIQVDVSAISTNSDLILELTASSGLLESDYYDHTAAFSASANGAEANGTFTWEVKEEHVRQQAYQVVFRAQDDANELGSTAYYLLRYRVQGVVNVDEVLTTFPGLTIFPNPAIDQINIQLEEQFLESAYQLFSKQGQLVLEGLINSNSTIDVRELPAGTYQLIVTLDRQSISKKIIKLN